MGAWGGPLSGRWAWCALFAAIVCTGVCTGCGGGSSGEPDTASGPDVTEVEGAPCDVDEDCLDDHACTWDERCGDGGTCEVRWLSCEDGNDCTEDKCEADLGCTFVPHEGVCDDDDPCTLGDVCRDGNCFFDAYFDCDDGNVCTRDVCDPNTGGCTHEPEPEIVVDVICDDGNACTENMRCEAGTCVGDPVVCDDDTLCAIHACDTDLGCVTTFQDVPCDDGDLCTLGDRCADGACAPGQARECDDGELCTDDLCDPASGCQFPANTAPCDDGISCTSGDACEDFECRSGAEDCDDGNPCTLDICNAAKGCVHAPTPGPCEDDDPCFVGDYCAAGECVAGDEPFCVDDDICTSDSCLDVGGEASCEYNAVGDCLGAATTGDYLGFFSFDYEPGPSPEIDCFGTGVAHLLGNKVVASGTCKWFGSSLANKAVLFSLSANLSGDAIIEDEGNTVSGRTFLGTATFQGALEGTVSGNGTITVYKGVPELKLQLEGGQIAAPPSAQPQPISASLLVQLSEDEVGMCCPPDSDVCFPGDASLCELQGAPPPEVATGECCFEADGQTVCADVPQSWCEETNPDAVYFGPQAYACATGSACTQVTEQACADSGGEPKPGLDCSDGDGDGFPDAVPAPPGCGLEGVVTCTHNLSAGTLEVDLTGLAPIELIGSWVPAPGGGSFTTTSDFEIVFGDVTVPVPVPLGTVEITCDPLVAVTGEVGFPNLSEAEGFSHGLLSGSQPQLSLGFGLGQDVEAKLAPDDEGQRLPLAPCAAYVFFQVSTGMAYDLAGVKEVELIGDSDVLLVIDPFDPAFFFEASGQIVSGPSAGFANKIGFGLSRKGQLQWNTALPVPPAAGKPPTGRTLSGHVFQTGDFGLIPIPKSPVQLYVDGEVVVDMGPFPDAAEAVLAGLFKGDLAKVEAALQTVASDVSSDEILDEIAYGVNAYSLRVEAPDLDGFVVELGQATLMYEARTLRFSADGLDLPGLLASAPSALVEKLDQFVFGQSYRAYGFVSEDIFELSVEADFTLGPVKAERNRVTITFDGENFDVDAEVGNLAFDLDGWLDELKSLFDCDVTQGDEGCNVGGLPVANIDIQTGEDGLEISMELSLPADLGTAQFNASVGPNGETTFVSHTAFKVGAWQTNSATLTLRDDGIDVVMGVDGFLAGTTFEGTINWDGTFSFKGSQSQTWLGFITQTISMHLTTVGGVVEMGVSGIFSTPFGDAEMTGTLGLDGEGELLVDMTGTADFDVFGFSGVKGSVRITNMDTPGAYIDLDLDLVLLEAQLEGQFLGLNDYFLSGSGNLKIPGFADLATGAVSITPDKGIWVEGSLGVAGQGFDFEGHVGPESFKFTGENNVALLGFQTRGWVNFQGDANDASFAFDGSVDAGGSTVKIAGSVNSGGQFSFAGKGQLKFFGYSFGEAALTFSNDGLRVSGEIEAIPGATFKMSGDLESNGDFSLESSADAKLEIIAGLSGDFNASVTKKGSLVTAKGSGSVSFAGVAISGGFIFASNGTFEFTGGISIDIDLSIFSIKGGMSLKVSNAGFVATVSADGCVRALGTEACDGFSRNLKLDGKICIDFPLDYDECWTLGDLVP